MDQNKMVQLEVLPFTNVPIAEIRRPEFIDTVEDLLPAEQGEYVDDLAVRVIAASEESPAVCHLDTGVARTRRSLAGSLDAGDMHTVIGESGFDRQWHGTSMAGLALYGSLDECFRGLEQFSFITGSSPYGFFRLQMSLIRTLRTVERSRLKRSRW